MAFQQVLERAPTHDHEGLSLALQLALGRRDLPMVEVLMDLAASPRYVELERLFIVDFNRYRLKGASAEQWRDMSPAAIHTRAMRMRHKTRKNSTLTFVDRCSRKQLGVSSAASVIEAACGTALTLGASPGPPRPSGSRPIGPSDSFSGSGAEGSCKASRSFMQSRSLTNARRTEQQEGTQPFAILVEWVEGYQHSVHARWLHDALVPSWLDLMLWAVLCGEDALVLPLWQRTRDPLRAALLASKCCQRLSTLPHLRSDQEHLKERATDFEDWAIGTPPPAAGTNAEEPPQRRLPHTSPMEPQWSPTAAPMEPQWSPTAAPMEPQWSPTAVLMEKSQ